MYITDRMTGKKLNQLKDLPPNLLSQRGGFLSKPAGTAGITCSCIFPVRFGPVYQRNMI